jgi:hypothetical protein
MKFENAMISKDPSLQKQMCLSSGVPKPFDPKYLWFTVQNFQKQVHYQSLICLNIQWEPKSWMGNYFQLVSFLAVTRICLVLTSLRFRCQCMLQKVNYKAFCLGFFLLF